MKLSFRLIIKAFVLALALLLPFPLFAADGTVLRIGGTGGALGTVRELARAFQKKHRDIRIIVPPSLGSSGGIKALLSGALDIAVSSRPLSQDERRRGAGATEYGRTPFIFITSRKTKAINVTMKQLASIYTGQMKTWPTGIPVRPILRPAGDTDNDYLKGMSPGMSKAVEGALSREGMVTAVTDQDNVDTILRAPGAFGASTLAQVITERRLVTILSINGVAPSVAALRNGSYPYYKCFYAVTGPAPNRTVQTFLDFLRSAEGSAILKKSGHEPEPYPSCKAEHCRTK